MAARVYLTLAPADLDALAQTGELTAAAVSAAPSFAVTPALRAAYPQEDEESWEYLALQEAAAATAAGQRVLVLAADVDGPVEPGGSAGAVTLASAVPIRHVVSLHVGDPGVAPDPDEETELSWYDVTELDDVRRLLGDH